MKRFLLLCAVLSLFSFIKPAEAQEGQLIKGSTAAVYYLIGGKRYVFPNSRIYFSWFTDFSSVKTITDTELQQYPLGGNIFYRPGTRLVKITSDPKVYAVGFNGALYSIASEQAAISLYGQDWSKRVDDLSDAFFAGYEIKGSLDGTVYPPGAVIRNTATKQMYLLLEENGKTVFRTISRSLEDDLGIPAAYIQTVNSLAYPSGTNTEDVSTFTRPVQIAVGNDPTTLPPEQLPVDGTLTIHREDTIGVKKIIREAPSAAIFEFTLKGDAFHTVQITEIPLEFYIDANDGDSDFQLGTDQDVNVTRTIDQLIKEIKLVDKSTGVVLALKSETSNNQLLRMPVNLSIAPTKSVTLQVVVSTISIPSPIPRFSVDVPTKEVHFSIPTASEAKLAGDTKLNGGFSPKSYATYIDHGTLAIDDKDVEGNEIRFFGQETTPFKLTLTAQDEPIELRTLSLSLTSNTDDVLLIRKLALSYVQDGQTIVHEYDRFEDNTVYVFTDLGLTIDENKTAELSVLLTIADYTQTLSNKRVQLAFTHDYFFATAQYSRYFFSSTGFGGAGSDKTGSGPVYRIRNAMPLFQSGPDAPSGVKNRFNSTHVMTFNAIADKNPVGIYKMSFKVETNNVAKTGPLNDTLELLATKLPYQASKLFVRNEIVTGGRAQRTAESVTFVIFRPSVGIITDFDGYESKVGDYGIFVYNFGTSPFQLSTEQKSVFELELDTSVIPATFSATIKTTLLAGADFSWDDGSKKLADGSYVKSLPISSAVLSFSQTQNP